MIGNIRDDVKMDRYVLNEDALFSTNFKASVGWCSFKASFWPLSEMFKETLIRTFSLELSRCRGASTW